MLSCSDDTHNRRNHIAALGGNRCWVTGPGLFYHTTTPTTTPAYHHHTYPPPLPDFRLYEGAYQLQVRSLVAIAAFLAKYCRHQF